MWPRNNPLPTRNRRPAREPRRILVGGRWSASTPGDPLMPVQTSYPGVYSEEIPSGVHTITGVATSIAAFIGGAGRGAGNQPRHPFSVAAFQRLYRGLHTQHPPWPT